MKIESVQKIAANLHDKNEYIIYIRNLKQALNHGLVLKKVHKVGQLWKNVHKVIKFNQNAWLKPYIDMNTDLSKKQKMILKKIFLSLWLMQFLEKLWKRWEILMNKPVCLGLSLLELSKILAYEFW